MEALTTQDVYVGVPADEAARKEAGDTGISNAHLAYVHEHGVPEKNIPARPALIPGIQDALPEAVELLEEAAKFALEGNPEAVTRNLTRVGEAALKGVKRKFDSNDWEPLAESTNKARLRKWKGKSHNKARMKKGEEPPTVFNPLVDSNQLRNSYTYVLRKRGKGTIVE